MKKFVRNIVERIFRHVSDRSDFGDPKCYALDNVWAGSHAQFGIVATTRLLYVGYYDSNRQLTICQYRLPDLASSSFYKLDSWVGSDSHANIALSVDEDGALHVAANMHVDPLNYFRSAPDGDVRTLRRITEMNDTSLERRVTYPEFVKMPDGKLVFKYRDGSSGDGSEIYLIYNAGQRNWSSLHFGPFVDGEGLRSAYFVGPTLGEDGYFHVTWVWRDSPLAETNHDLCYARSRDLIRWEKADGSPLALPIRYQDSEVVDPVPIHGGIINNNTVLGFDAEKKVVITYHKFISDGTTQIWVARRNGLSWDLAQASDWPDFRWDFSGKGSLDFQVSVGSAVPGPNDTLVVPVRKRNERLELILDSKTLKRKGQRLGGGQIGIACRQYRPSRDLQFNSVSCYCGGKLYVAAWASVPPNRDKPGSLLTHSEQLKLYVF